MIMQVLYRKLLTLYPQAFRARFGESMEQTFSDLCREREQVGGNFFGFAAWMFVETAMGIGREHVLSFQETNLMKNTLVSLKAPVLVSFVVVLPFILLQWLTVTTKGLDFNTRDLLDSFVLFGFLWLGIAALLLILIPLIGQFRSPKAHAVSGETALPSNTGRTVLVGFLMALPFLTLLSLLVLHIEPPLGPLEALLDNPNPDQPDVLGTLIFLGSFLLAVAGGLTARAPLMQALQRGGSLLAHPLSLLVVLVVLGFIVVLVTNLIADQYPCWVGVPNCD